jgi:hypothetical protein
MRRVNTTVLLRRAARTLRPAAPRAVIRQPNDAARDAAAAAVRSS